MSSLEGFKGLNTVRIETSLKYDEKLLLLATEQSFAVTQICYIWIWFMFTFTVFLQAINT